VTVTKPSVPDAQPTKSDDITEEVSDEAASIAEFLSQFSGGTHQFVVYRLEPRTFVFRGREHRISGHLRTFYHPPSIDQIAQLWGGGLYEIRVMGPSGTGKGSFHVKSCRKVEIAGDPKNVEEPRLDEQPVAVVAPVPESPALVQQILEHTFADKRRVEERFERERQRLGGPRGELVPDRQRTIGAARRRTNKRPGRLLPTAGRASKEDR
jgi:hypothetical protein